MRPLLTASLLLALRTGPAAAVEAPLVTARFSVGVPAGTPEGSSICIGGNATALGSWKPDGLVLKKEAGGRYGGNIQVSAGTEIRFKVTRGS